MYVRVTKTRLAILGTMGDLHSEPLTYDLNSLRSIVVALAPDMLCAEITRLAWEEHKLNNAALEVREVLTPITRLTGSVLVPIAPSSERFEDFVAPPGLRQSLVRAFDRLLRWGQRNADRPEKINGPVFEAFCHAVCTLTEMAWSGEERAAWEAQNSDLVGAVLEVVRRDPGRRVLVAVQCQRLHKLLPLLKQYSSELEIVDYRHL